MGVYFKGITIDDLQGCCPDIDRLIDEGRTIEVKEPHGNLIDANHLLEAFPVYPQEMNLHIYDVRSKICVATAMIEEEG